MDVDVIDTEMGQGLGVRFGTDVSTDSGLVSSCSNVKPFMLCYRLR